MLWLQFFVDFCPSARLISRGQFIAFNVVVNIFTANFVKLKPKSDETVSVTGLPLMETGAHCRHCQTLPVSVNG